MKNPKIAFLVAGLVVLGLAGTYFAHVLPFGGEVGALNDSYQSARQQAEEATTTIESTSEAREIPSVVASLSEVDRELIAIQESLEELSERRDAVRDTWWEFSFTVKTIDELKAGIALALRAVPGRSQAVLEASIEETANAVDESRTFQEVEAKIQEIEADIGAVVTSLVAVSSTKEELAAHKEEVLDSARPALSAMATSSILALGRIRESATKSARSQLESHNSLSEVVKTANAHLALLQSEEEVLSRVTEFNPAKKVFGQEFSAIKESASQMKLLLGIGKRIVKAQKSSNKRLEAGIEMMDHANARLSGLEMYASSSVIKEVYDSWSRAVSQVGSANSALSDPSRLSKIQRNVWANCNRRALLAVDSVYDQAIKHRDFVGAKYSEARREESTLQGALARGTRRGLDRFSKWAGRAMGRASQTRIGKEIGVSAKVLILGTKAFYDLQDPNTDIMTWAMSYEDDVDQLMRETEEIQRMEQPSITGKNTFIEDLVNNAYEQSFEN